MKKKLFIILGALVLSISLLFSYIVKDNKEENNKEISKVEKILSKPEGIQAYTLNGKKTDISYNDLIEGYEIDSITCKNGTVATYNKEDNSVSLSNIHMPDYCTMDFKLGTYIVTIDAGGGYFGTSTEIDDGYSDALTLAKGVSYPVYIGNTLNLTPNQKYMLSFDYWSLEGSTEFNVDLFPDSLPEIHPVATTTQQTMNWIFSSSSSDMTSSQIRYFNDRTVPNPQQIAIINKHLYKCDDCTLTYTKEVTKGNAYGSLNTPKRYGWDFLGWYLEDGTKIDSTSINNIKGNHTVTAKWSHHNYQVKLVGVNGTIEYAPIWYYMAGWEKAFTKLTANNGYTTNGATVSCTGSAGASISGDYLYLSNITEDQTCTVTFKKLTYNVTLSVVNGSGSTTKTVDHGNSVSFTGISPYSGYSSSNPTVSCIGGRLSGSTLTVSNVTSSRTCTITFKKLTYSVTLSVVNGSGSATKTVDHGSSVSFTGISPYSGYSSSNPTVSCTGGSLSGSTLTVSNVTSSRTCSITFKGITLLSKLLANNPTISTRSDFDTAFITTNTGTLYTSTESIAGSAAKTVYYFAGNATNNWVKFGGFYWRIIRTNHDSSIRLLYAGTSPDTTSGYIGTSNFNIDSKLSKYVGYMYGDPNPDGMIGYTRTANLHDSVMKTYIDNWYSTNLSNYTKYLSLDAVYCNDREVYGVSNAAWFAASNRIISNHQPSFNCTNIIDAFSVNNSSAKLTYPIALMTADEVAYAGGHNWTPLSSPYAWYYSNSAGGSITGTHMWITLSPHTSSQSGGYLFTVTGSNRPGVFNNFLISSSGIAVRPVISIKSDALWSSGNGSSSSPYEIVYN